MNTQSIYLIFFILSLLFPFISASQPQASPAQLTFPISLDKFKNPKITLSVGTPPQTFKFLLTTYSSKIYLLKSLDPLDNKSFKSELSSTYIQENITIPLNFLGEGTEGDFAYETIHFNLLQLKRFHFVEIINHKDYDFRVRGILGLDYLAKASDRDNKSPFTFSFLTQLFEQGFLTDQMFIIGKFLTDYKDDYGNNVNTFIRFGHLPDNFSKNEKNYRKVVSLIKFDDKNQYTALWKTNLHSIVFDNGEAALINEEIVFGISMGYLTVSLEFFSKYIEEMYFGSHINSKMCKVLQEEYNSYILCYNEFDESQIPELRIVFGKWSIKIKRKNLWIYDVLEDQKLFRIIYHKEKKYTWSFNYSLIEDEYSMVFDRAKGQVAFVLNSDLI